MGRAKKPAPAPLSAQLAPLRQGIDAVDDKIVALLNQRAALAQRIGQLKNRAAAPAYVPERERQVLERLIATSHGPLSEDTLRLIYKEIISASLALESPLQVAFLGAEAGLAHEAGKRHFGLSAHLRPQQTLADVFTEVQAERCAFGVVPVEGSAEGLHHATLDMFIAHDVGVCAEVVVRKNYHLLSRHGTLESVTRVLAQPAEGAACRRWLAQHLPGTLVMPVASTAEAAQEAQRDPKAAVLVLGSVAASLYRLQTAASNVKDSGSETKRFWIVGHHEAAPTGKDRTSLLFAMKDVQGILYKGLQAFARAKINLTRIESRPGRRRHWDYLFFVDLEGHRHDPPLRRALAQLAEHCIFLKILGSYARGRDASRAGRGRGDHVDG